jgi:hypothetical protein
LGQGDRIGSAPCRAAKAGLTNHPSRLAEVGSHLRMTPALVACLLGAYSSVFVSASENASSVRSSRSGVTET